jgi:hypothetical protein
MGMNEIVDFIKDNVNQFDKLKDYAFNYMQVKFY